MVIKAPGRVSVALFVDRVTAGQAEDFSRDAARVLAKRELEEAGVSPYTPIEVEAYEGEQGWMVFAYSDIPKKEAFFSFADGDAMLEALCNKSITANLEVFSVGSRYIIHMTAADGPGFDSSVAHISEYGRRFDAQPLYFLHLKEQATGRPTA